MAKAIEISIRDVVMLTVPETLFDGKNVPSAISIGAASFSLESCEDGWCHYDQSEKTSEYQPSTPRRSDHPKSPKIDHNKPLIELPSINNPGQSKNNQPKPKTQTIQH